MSEHSMATDRGPADNLRREWRRLITTAQTAFAAGQTDLAHEQAILAAELAERSGTRNLLRATSRIVLGMSEWGLSARLLAQAQRLQSVETLPEWDGKPSEDCTLLVRQLPHEHVGRPVRYARFLPMAAERVGRCIVSVDARLVSLFQRSFPMLDVLARDHEDKARNEADAVAGFQTLVAQFGVDDAAVRASFRPLRADPAAVTRLRARYAGKPGALIGINWMSTNEKKDVPALQDWAELMRRQDATYVSLQYGDVASDIAALREMSGKPLIHDNEVDPFQDFNAAAAQIAAMDAVVSISSTCAHLAGALGARTFVPLDTMQGYWPRSGETIAWYPATNFFRNEGGAWDAVFGKIESGLKAFLAARRG
jgi:hypothetical protein